MTGWEVWGHSGKFSADWEGDVKEDKQGCLGITAGDGEPWGFMEDPDSVWNPIVPFDEVHGSGVES